MSIILTNVLKTKEAKNIQYHIVNDEIAEKMTNL